MCVWYSVVDTQGDTVQIHWWQHEHSCSGTTIQEGVCVCRGGVISRRSLGSLYNLFFLTKTMTKTRWDALGKNHTHYKWLFILVNENVTRRQFHMRLMDSSFDTKLPFHFMQNISCNPLVGRIDLFQLHSLIELFLALLHSSPEVTSVTRQSFELMRSREPSLLTNLS